MRVETKTFIRDVILNHLFPEDFYINNTHSGTYVQNFNAPNSCHRINSYLTNLLNLCNNDLECCEALPPDLRSVAFNMQGIDLTLNTHEFRILIDEYKEVNHETVTLLQELMLVHLLLN